MRKRISKQISRSSKQNAKKSPPLHCSECEKTIAAKDQALFVEEDVGRYFCSEPCIVSHFTPDIEKLERQYGRHVTANDLTSAERERFAHFRWMSLEQPDEVWCEKTLKGDHRYVLVAEFKPENKTIWAVAICLMLRDEPSFLYLAFVTADRNLVDAFAKGDRLKITPQKTEHQAEIVEAKKPIEEVETAYLAEPWTEADSLRANILKSRTAADIPVEDFGFYQNCLEETLQEPNELWSYQPKSAKKVYHFIRRYEHDKSFWYVVIAKDTADETQIEIMDAFPTNDEGVVQLCRYGLKENLANQTSGVEMPLAATGSGHNVH